MLDAQACFRFPECKEFARARIRKYVVIKRASVMTYRSQRVMSDGRRRIP